MVFIIIMIGESQDAFHLCNKGTGGVFQQLSNI